ncbi:MAG TPA: class I SAM-dependent methyltransferase [Gemmatimonadaceae bacterium]|nr:class I SAM-dependent methyltransferase [Gemmatimonadaceae bacterium]
MFSNPVCDWGELEAFYRDDYWSEHWPKALSRDPGAVEAAVELQRVEVKRMMRHGAAGRLLEVGSGTGGLLAAARAEGMEVWGVEPSSSGVAHAREVFGLENVIHGTIPDDRLAQSTFDVVCALQVIEHVTDLDEFVKSLSVLLKPGGLLWIATENYRNSSHYIERTLARLRGRPAPFATASEHTMVFTTRTLRDAIQRRGFDVTMCEGYQPSLSQKTKTMKFRSPFSRAYFAAQHGANAIARTGPLLRLAAIKRE